MAEYAEVLLGNLAYSGASAGAAVPPYRYPEVEAPEDGETAREEPFRGSAKAKEGERVRLKGARAEVRPKTRQYVPLFAVAGTLLVALVMIRLLVGYVSLTRLSHEAAELERRIAELMEEQAKLEIRYERAFDLEQVERYAMAELGMVRAGSEQKVYLNNALDDNAVVLAKTKPSPAVQISEKIRAYFGSLLAYLK